MFFSIVIPTRNRSSLLNDTLFSALNQDFDDFEVIVSDNFSDDETRDIIASYQSNQRLRTYTTSEVLSMPRHWEFASLKASGRYVLILTDRSVLRMNALRQIFEAIQSKKEDVFVCVWPWSTYDKNTGISVNHTTNPRVIECTSSSVIHSFLNENICPYELPRGLNSCYRSDLASQIRVKNGVLFDDLTPDYSSAFLLLFNIQKLLFINSDLCIQQGGEQSNGGRCLKNLQESINYLNTLNKQGKIEHSPISCPIVWNIVYDDFLRVQKDFSSDFVMNWVEYFVVNYKSIISLIGSSLNARNEVSELLSEWRRGLSLYDGDTQHSVYKRIKELKLEKIKYYLRYTLIGVAYRKLKDLLKSCVFRIRHIKDSKLKIREYAGF